MTGTLLHGPLVCFRVVTKGTCPTLVKNNVERNINTCSGLGLSNFIFEVVTDKAINIPKNLFVREIVVPFNYRTSKRTLYKARALQYCLEDCINMLKDEDWIVHLDEETVLTRASVTGILNFITKGTASFGQGIISYANEEIFFWITTIFDLARVGTDYGILRFCLKFFKKPVFSWKGSYVVSNVGAERKVSYDFGIEGSIAEDCFFGLTAWKLGYSFDFIEGEMWEKSPFSLTDYIKQRKRWIQGITMTFISKNIPFKQKCGILFIILGWITMPLTVPNTVLVPLYPLPMPRVFSFLFGFMGGVMMFLFIIGALKSFNYQRIGLIKFVVVCLSPVLLLPFFVLTETCAVVYAFLTFRTIEFQTVKKEDRIIDVDGRSAKRNYAFDA
ncbi:beta-1,4-mannosyltransferase egh-like [Saccostrea echinata]|uniref:beta-1,4-mannosyltransferase egh-like n=1 Tax=Saccostrea echinata TaxID=191078 RepID=UPI002A82BF11|nr:beta-1,4-mannosyltransferase egh-like [Saccostrea echinata]